MGAREQTDAVKTARVIRAGRKLLGKSQADLAGLLQVSKATIARFERAQQAPSASTWHQICQYYMIDSVDSFEFGFIDGGALAAQETPFRDSRFRLPQRYCLHPGSMVRVVRPFLKYFSDRLGGAALDAYLDSQGIDPDFFAVYDNRLNVAFTLDLATWLIEAGHLKLADVPALVSPLNAAEMHGRLHEIYCQAPDRKALLTTFLANIGRYERNSVYEIVEESKAKLVVSVVPSREMRYFDYRNATLGTFLCDYRKAYARRFSRYTGGKAAGVTERECHFKGGRQCLYEISLGT